MYKNVSSIRLIILPKFPHKYNHYIKVVYIYVAFHSGRYNLAPELKMPILIKSKKGQSNGSIEPP